MSLRRVLGLALLTALPLSCTSSNPSGPEPSPSPSVTPSPDPTPSPTPTPTPSPSPTPSGNQNPAVDVRASVTSFLRYGRLIRGRAATFIPGDVLYLTCTPLDRLGKPTKNHGRIQDWLIFSDTLVDGVDFVATDKNTFNPDVHVSERSHNGEIRAKCRVDFMTSASVPMVIEAPQ